MDITETLTPNSSQLNAEDLLAGPRVVTVEKVTKGSAEQPVDIHLAEFPGRPFRPSKTVRRLIVAAWGPETSNYTGRKMLLYRDAAVKFGGMEVGGIRVSAMSHLDAPVRVALTTTRGKRAFFTVEPLAESEPSAPKQSNPTKIIEAFSALNVNAAQLETKIGRPHTEWTADDITKLAALGKAIKAGETTPHEEFDTGEPQQGELGQDGVE